MKKYEFLNTWVNMDPQKQIGWWNAWPETLKEKIWNNYFEDIQRIKLWGLLEDFKNKDIWNFLKVGEKATFLEALSRNYTLAHMAFAAKKILKELLKETKYSQEYEEIEISLLQRENLGINKAIITNDNKLMVMSKDHKILYLTINYDIEGGIVEYDKEGCILDKCARRLVGHEIGHIILHLHDVIDNVINDKDPYEYTSEYAEEEAN